MASLADKIGNEPVLLLCWMSSYSQRRRFRAATGNVRRAQKALALLCS